MAALFTKKYPCHPPTGEYKIRPYTIALRAPIKKIEHRVFPLDNQIKKEAYSVNIMNFFGTLDSLLISLKLQKF